MPGRPEYKAKSVERLAQRAADLVDGIMTAAPQQYLRRRDTRYPLAVAWFDAVQAVLWADEALERLTDLLREKAAAAQKWHSLSCADENGEVEAVDAWPEADGGAGEQAVEPGDDWPDA